jgi:hypothetical protein
LSGWWRWWRRATLDDSLLKSLQLLLVVLEEVVPFLANLGRVEAVAAV